MIVESMFELVNSECVVMELLEEYLYIDGIVVGNDLIVIGIVKVVF